MEGGMRAAHAIASGAGDGLAAYGEWGRHEYARYLAQLLGSYALERRWPEATFWHGRHVALERGMAH